MCSMEMFCSSTYWDVEACLHFLASKWLLTQVGMDYKSNQVAYIIRMTIASQWVLWAESFRNTSIQVIILNVDNSSMYNYIYRINIGL